MKKVLAFLLVFVIFTFGCTTTQNNDLESAESQLPPNENEGEDKIVSGNQPESESGDNPTEQPPVATPLPDGTEGPADNGESEEPASDPNLPPEPPEPTLPLETEPDPEPTPELKEFYIEADDSGFYDESGSKLTNLELNNGDEVTITFFVRKTGTYFGGMTIRGLKFDSGKIEKEEEYVVKFIAEEGYNFKIKSYWPTSNKLKATLNVNVN